MAICPGCGNQIQAWAHGVCYTCRRTNKEHQRYGHRRPKQTYRRNQIDSHRLHAHNLGPLTGNRSNPPKQHRPAKQTVPSNSKELTGFLVSCPVCKSYLPKKELQAHLAGHLSAREKGHARRIGRAGKVTRSTKRTKPAKDPVDRRKHSPTDYRLLGINQLLVDIYEKTSLLSAILMDNGLSYHDISRIKSSKLRVYLSSLVGRWLIYWKKNLPPLCVNYLLLCYGLNGCKPQTIPEFTASQSLSKSTTSQLRSRTLSLLRTSQHKFALEKTVVMTARSVLAV